MEDKLLEYELSAIDNEIDSLRTTYSTFIEWLEYKRDEKRVWELKRQYMLLLSYRSIPKYIEPIPLCR